MNRDKVLGILILGLIGLMLISIFTFCLIITIDAITTEKTGTKMVPCVDKYNRPFQDELCEKTITCSKLGWVGDKKCS